MLVETLEFPAAQRHRAARIQRIRRPAGLVAVVTRLPISPGRPGILHTRSQIVATMLASSAADGASTK